MKDNIINSKRKLGTCLGMGYNVPKSEQLRVIKDAGFSAFFTMWSDTAPIRELRERGEALGLEYETLHAPFSGMNCLWLDGVDGDDYRDMLLRNVDCCADNGIGIMVTHVTVAAVAPPPSEVGAERFRALFDRAGERGVRIALENLEIPEHLAFLFGLARDMKQVGFCWDTGHNNCYTPDIDMMALYGDRLICTHINDNLGIVEHPPAITWHDDVHYMPFDGTVDWNAAAARIRAAGYSGTLTLELTSKKKVPQNPDTRYERMSFEEFVRESYVAAERFAAMCDGGEV